MQNQNELKEILKDYQTDGDIVELWNVVSSDALVLTTPNDIISVLSRSKTNYIRVGYGDTIFKAYENGYAKGGLCKLVHIYFSERGMCLIDLYKFIESLGDDIIFGYTKDEIINNGVKLVMIFN